MCKSNRIYTLNNLYVVESPLQALCALEVSLGKHNEHHFIIARLSNEARNRNNQQILKILQLREWNNKIIIKPLVSRNKYINIVRDLKQLSEIRKKFRSKIDSLYIGEFRYEFMHMIRCAVDANNVYLLDDGAATVKVIQDYIKNGKYHPTINLSNSKNILKRTIYKYLYGKYKDKKILAKKIEVITAFANEDINYGIKELKFNNIKKLYKDHRTTDDKIVYYYGSKYSEAGVISLEYELEFLSSIKSYYDKKDMQIFYFSHRDESEEKLSVLENELNFIIRRNDDIAELHLLKSSILPKEVAGAYTSTLNNIRNLFPDMNITSFRIVDDKINNVYKEGIDCIYRHYNEIGISIERLDK